MRGPRLGARLWWGVALLVAGLWAGGLLVLPELPGLPVVPSSTLWLLPVARYARDIAAALTAGAAVFGLLMASGTARRWFRGWALAWLGILVPFALLTVSDAEALSAAESASALPHFLAATLIGQVLIVQVVLLALALALSWGPAWARWSAVVLVMVAVVAPSLVGHGGLSSTHTAATVSLGLHFGGASLWMGGLAVVVALVVAGGPAAEVELRRFSVLALWCVIIVGESGLLSSSLRLPTPSAFTGTLYGSMVLAKALALGLLIRWGWLQRTRVVQRFGIGERPARTLAKFAARELTVMGAAVALGILLARVGPPDPGSPTRGFTVLSLALVALALPLLVVKVSARRPAALQRLGRYPESVALAFLVVVAALGVVGVLNAFLGDGLGIIVAGALLCGAGWCWLVATDRSRSWTDVAIVMVAWPVVAWRVASSYVGPAGGLPATVLSVLATEALLAFVLRSRTRVDQHQYVAATVAG